MNKRTNINNNKKVQKLYPEEEKKLFTILNKFIMQYVSSFIVSYKKPLKIIIVNTICLHLVEVIVCLSQ